MPIENPKYFSADDTDSEPEKNKKEQQTSEEKLKDEVEQFLAEQLAQDTEFFSKELTPEEFRVWQERNQTDFIHLSQEKQDALMTNLGNKLGEISKQIEEAEKNPTNLPKGGLEYLRNYQTAVRNKLQAYHLVFDKQEQTSEQLNLEQNILSIIRNAEVVINQKELDPKDKIELLNDYAKKLAKLAKSSSEKISLPELIKDKNKLREFINGISQMKEKEPPPPEAVKQAQEFIKKEEKKGKDSIFNKMGGWGTVGSIAAFSLLMFLILIFLSEFKLLEKATGFDLEGGGGKKK
ncbi:MAG: hypothetical protein GYA31_00110 [Parcubacteria group bacterium]|nr:hypothetical protein [Parcubacteria group bacterium]